MPARFWVILPDPLMLIQCELQFVFIDVNVHPVGNLPYSLTYDEEQVQMYVTIFLIP